MSDTKVDTEDLKQFLSEDPKRESQLIEGAPISKSLLQTLKNGYQPRATTAKAINNAMASIRNHKAAG